jgi:hypothetical protein
MRELFCFLNELVPIVVKEPRRRTKHYEEKDKNYSHPATISLTQAQAQGRMIDGQHFGTDR